MRGIALCLLLGLLLPGSPASLAEEPTPPPLRAEASVSRREATVGDVITIQVVVTHPPDVKVSPPSPVAGEASLLVEALPQRSPESKSREVFLFRGQAFETGKAFAPAFQVDWSRAGGASGAIRTDPVPVEIVSVLKTKEEQPADLKSPASLPAPPFPWRTAAALGALLLLIGSALFWWMRRRRPRPAAVRTKAGPTLSPHEQAYRDLERLLASSLLRDGKLKEFHIELAEITKRYLGGRFGIETLERTTEEVLQDLKTVRVGVTPLGTARELLSQTDLVKFAKHRPAGEEVRETVDRAYRLVDLTKPVPPPVVPAAGSAPPGLSTEHAG